MKTRNIREVKKKTRFDPISKGNLVVEEWYTVKAETKIAKTMKAFNERLNKLEEKMEVLGSGKMIMMNEDEEYDKKMKAKKELGVDDSEEVEFTKEELETLIYITELMDRTNETPDVSEAIIDKLNKMLKEKE